MDIAAAQREMRAAYRDGAPGIVVSGLVWLIAGAVWLRFGVATGFAALFVGGMVIFPASVALSRTVFRAPPASAANPLQRLGLETTFLLFAGILIAWLLLRVAPELTFPVMAITIGARYAVFRSVYGDARYWAFGGVVVALGAVAALGRLPINVALAVGAVELAFAAILFARRSA